MNIDPTIWLLANQQDSEFRLWMIRTLIGLLVALGVLSVYYYLTNRHRQPATSRNWWSKVLYVAFLFSAVVLAVTSFGSILQQEIMQHYALLGHLAAAGAFVFLLFPIACIYLPRSLNWSRNWWFESLSAWVLVLSSLTVAGTMLISMLPIASTEELLQLARVHRFAGLMTVSSALLHAFSLGIQRLGIR